MSLSALERWYARQCNGAWELGSGIRIESLDNPGWQVHISLRDTKKQRAQLWKVRIDRDERNWIHYWIDGQVFHIACGPTNLSEAIGIFVDWFDSE
ncbi:MAG: Imm53 family immunity protein [Candidatus Sulfotelmatobacter sp.]